MPNTQQPRHDNTNDRQDKPEPIATEKVRCESERKKFFLDLNENRRGIVLRIKEASDNGRHNFIMIPGEAIADFCVAMDRILEAYEQQ
jgi:hypothetical protein